MEFLYDSGLAVGKGSSGFKALESLPKTQPEAEASSSASAQVLYFIEDRLSAFFSLMYYFYICVEVLN